MLIINFSIYFFFSEVANGKVQFLTIVESLQGVLTHENVTIRTRGIEYLSWVLTQVPHNLFHNSEIKVIVDFFCNCLNGHHSIQPPTIKGLLSVVSNITFVI